eukprot:GHVU01123247.1.p1 GENE.GHVU01123247.1~~GHVU01123247.1.p1  ORF type:complete len:335 (+),score=5.85 GHVU01123247.1:118-1122(+)
MDIHPVLSSLGRMSLTATWLESMIYGLNCVLFGGCMYVLSIRRRRTHRILFASCVFHILISTAHAILSFIQLLNAFPNPSTMSVPHGLDLYFATPSVIVITNLALYVSNVFMQDLLLIWKLYVVLGRCWEIALVALITEGAHLACAITSVVLIAQPNAHLFSPNVQAFGKVSWSLDLFLNTTVTSGIAYRLWRADRNISTIEGHHTYKATMFAVIESGALIATCTVVMFALDIAGSPAGLAAVNVAVQVATTTPLLIIVRLGLGLTHGDSPSQGRVTKGSSSSLHCARPPTQFHGSTTEDTCTYPMHSISGSSVGKSAIDSFFESRDSVVLDSV